VSCEDLIDADVRDSSRQAAAGTLGDRCSILRPTKTQKPSGGWTETLNTVATNRPCRVSNTQRQSQERTAAGEARNIKSRDIRLLATEDVRDTDVINVTELNGATCDFRYEVLDPGDVSDMILRVVQCKQIA